MEKRGALTSEQIIGLVLAIIGFTIIIAFATHLGTNDYSTDEICRLSVLSRATAAEILPGTQQAVPLQCATKKICLTATSKGECPQFVGEKDVVNVQLPAAKDEKSNEQQAIEISKVMAQNMYDCWNIMGQGKLDLFSTATSKIGFSQSKSKCVICSRIALSEDISPSVLKAINLDNYIEKNTVPGTSRTYLEYFSDGTTNTYSKIDSSFKDEDVEGTDNQPVTLGGVNTNELAFVFMQVKTTDWKEAFTNQAQVLRVVAGGAFIAKPSSLISGGRMLFSTSGALATLAVVSLDASFVAYNSIASQDTAVGYCGSFTSKDKAAKGCSLLQSIPYTVKDIRALCGAIEGNI